jgi:signal transduction histidine kinase
VVVAGQGGPAAVGARIVFDDDTLPDRVRRSNTVVRVDDYALERDASLATEYGLAAAVAAPITVAGRVWGMLTATSGEHPLLAGTEARLDQFAQLVAAALASSQARDDLHALVDEQTALRRIAELAANDAPADQLLQAVAEEASALAGVEFGMVLRYIDADGGNQIVALDGAPDNFVLGMRASGSGDGSVHRVWRTGRAARVDDLGKMSGRWPQMAHERGFTASAGVPIVMRGALWGALIVAGRGDTFPTAIEEHLGHFAELAGTAIAATHARGELRLLADEQTALRRVAELVARGATLDEVFTAAATEASMLLGRRATALLRYDDGSVDRDVAVAVAVSNSSVPLGLQVPINTDESGDMLARVRRTGRPVRIESHEGTPLADIGAETGVAAGIAVPITVEGRVWGVLAASTSGPPLPAGSEERLTPIAELAAAAIANAENKAKLTASRARVVATADETRRRLQRDVHDGAQQRLVHTIIALKLAKDALAASDAAAGLLHEALSNAERANRELRDTVRGILPASLTRGGLGSGLESLVADLALPVDLTVTAPRLPAHIETTAYFVVAEAMTNVVKHANADRASVDVRLDDRMLVVEIRDDGVGGADPAAGTGLTGLFDRIEAGDGTLTVSSRPGAGTTIRATLPVGEHLSVTLR